MDEGAEHEQLRLGLKYSLSLRQNYDGVPPLTGERVRDGLRKAVLKEGETEANPTKKRKGKNDDVLRKALAVSMTEFPPLLLDHVFHVQAFDSTLKPEDIINSEKLLGELMQVLNVAAQILIDITTTEPLRCYILANRIDASKDQPGPDNEVGKHGGSGLKYEEFHPFKPKQFERNPSWVFLEFEGFNRTADEFFSSIEGQKLESRLKEREANAQRKLEHARSEHTKRISGLQNVQELHIRKAQAVEANLERVEEATAAINSLIAQGMDWVEINRLIEMEQKRNNPVAEFIKLPLKLHENTATMLLPEQGDEEEDFEGNETDSDPSESDDEEHSASKTVIKKRTETRLAVDIDLALSAWSNASQYYDQKKTAAVKEEKTIQASSKALKSTERKIAADLKKGLKQEKEVLRPVRRQFWFEKFLYFISSDGYLVLG